MSISMIEKPLRRLQLSFATLRHGYKGLASAARPAQGAAVEKADIPDPPAPLEKLPEWTAQSQRTGLIAKKMGMMQAWDLDGSILPITVLRVAENQVVQVKTDEKEGYTSLQLGADESVKPRRVSKPVLGHLQKAGVQPKRRLEEFRVTADAVLPVGTEITCLHFVPGQYVDVRALSKGKGFQGGIKRHNMKRQPKTHGNSLAHRALGGMGGCQDPGRVLPGKRMPGRMGHTNVTCLNLRVWKVEPRFNLVYVVGQVPGAKETFVRVRDAMRKKFLVPPPFPTYLPSVHGEPAAEVYQDANIAKVMR